MTADFSKIGKSNVNRSKAHERRVSKLLSEWSEQEFMRRRIQGRDHASRVLALTADVIAVDGDFIFSVEAKCGAGFSIDALFATTRTCKITEWWHQTCYDAQLLSREQVNKIYPMLFMKPIPAHDWIMFSAHTLPILTSKSGGKLQFPHISFDAYGWLGPISGNVSHTKVKKMVDVELDPAIICRWKDFSAAVCPTSAFYTKDK